MLVGNWMEIQYPLSEHSEGGGQPRPCHLQGWLDTARAAASRCGRPRAWLAPVRAAPIEAPPLGMVLAYKGGAYGHNAHRSCRPRGCDARSPTGATTLVVKGLRRPWATRPPATTTAG
ncbi:hypothetical protein BHE74_00056786 [Ensete ventricosum]|nr:hypothetical protein GW17_00005332 [Ensete ventricosum]RWW38020.1 hypothetical protein BHE74_00056786 [Ensete ventricosum]RZR93352.1 hypothetical protein BHM03_00021839 [Ensete ventricosum]